jgi:hypothetical protein
VGEAVNPHGAVGTAHHLRLAYAVVDTLERIGQRSALEFVRVGDDVSDSASGEIRDKAGGALAAD